jgi:TMEM175 potassium channel family protein
MMARRSESGRSSATASQHISGQTVPLGLERIVFFSDAVMAIAITLLAIDLRVPEVPPSAAAAGELALRLGELNPQIMSFVISFVVIGVYWLAHHRYFAMIRRYDAGLLMLNLLFLLFIVIMPFVASLLGHYPFLSLGIVPYAVDVSAIGLSIGAMWAYASHSHRLVDKDLDTRQIRLLTVRPMGATVVFILSIPAALIEPRLATLSWLLAPLVVLVINRVAHTRGALSEEASSAETAGRSN